jgi:hypothetical protein
MLFGEMVLKMLLLPLHMSLHMSHQLLIPHLHMSLPLPRSRPHRALQYRQVKGLAYREY